jgi:hypothetical protein
MPWYVFALVDAIPSGRAGRGLGGALAIRKLAGGFAVVERRADVPPMEFGSLKKHQEVVARLASRVPAILPVRFGTLLETEDLEAAVRERDEEIVEAFDVVRDRVQFTWRREVRRARREVRGASRDVRGATGELRGASGDVPGVRGEVRGAEREGIGAMSGTDYLRQIALAAKPAPPAAFRALAATLGPLIAAQRYQPGTAVLPEAVYHLVAKTQVTPYLAAADDLKTSTPQLTVTGPWAPFAFSPEIL